MARVFVPFTLRDRETQVHVDASRVVLLREEAGGTVIQLTGDLRFTVGDNIDAVAERLPVEFEITAHTDTGRQRVSAAHVVVVQQHDAESCEIFVAGGYALMLRVPAEKALLAAAGA